MNMVVLIAEPDQELRRICGRLSPMLGFRIETAADGLECWTKLRSRPPDVLVIDAEIPWGGGDGVLACLREHSNGARAPTVYVTGDDPPETLSARFGIPTGQCFQKPFELMALFDSVCKALAPLLPGTQLLCEELLQIDGTTLSAADTVEISVEELDADGGPAGWHKPPRLRPSRLSDLIHVRD